MVRKTGRLTADIIDHRARRSSRTVTHALKRSDPHSSSRHLIIILMLWCCDHSDQPCLMRFTYSIHLPSHRTTDYTVRLLMIGIGPQLDHLWTSVIVRVHFDRFGITITYISHQSPSGLPLRSYQYSNCKCTSVLVLWNRVVKEHIRDLSLIHIDV
jgi:hypothetical protein